MYTMIFSYSGQTLSQAAEKASNSGEIWNLFFTEEMLDLMVKWTNK